MKKQIIMLTAVSSIAFFSCRKENLTSQDESTQLNEVEMSSSSTRGVRPNMDSLVSNLTARFEFDGNLSDLTDKCPDGTPTMRGATQYGNDRMGKKNKALLLDGTYGVKLSQIPLQTKTSVSFWLLIANAYPNYNTYPLYGPGHYMVHRHTSNSWATDNPHEHEFTSGVFLDPQSDQFPYMNTSYTTYAYYRDWVHFAVTYDGAIAKFYVNGNLLDTNAEFPAAITPALVKYQLGFKAIGWGEDFWIGRMDDLRFYNIALSASQIQKIYTQNEIVDPIWETVQ